MRTSITIRILAIVAGVLLLTTGVVLTFTHFRLMSVADPVQETIYQEKINTIINILDNKLERLKKTERRSTYREAFQESVINTLIKNYYNSPDQQIYPFIIDNEGVVVMHPFLPRGDKSLYNTSFVPQIVELKNGNFNYVNTSGEASWSIFKSFPEWNWIVGYTVPFEEKYADVIHIRNELILILIAFVVFTVSLLSFIITKLMHPIIVLTAASKAMAAGDLDHPIDIKRKDELGVLASSFANMRIAVHEKINDLSQSEERFRILFNNISNAVFLHDSKGRVIDVNNTMLDLYGVTKEEALTMDIIDHFSGSENPAETLPDIWQHVLAGESITFEWIARKPHSGECFPVDVWLKQVSFGTEKLVLATVRNLSKQKEAEKQLLKEKKFTDAIIHTLPGIFYIYEDGERLIQWNKNLEEESGYSHDEMFNKHPLEWFDEKNRSQMSEALKKVFIEGGSSVEAELLFKDGPVPYHLTGNILNVDGRQYLIGVGFDISNRLELEEELSQAQKMEAIGTLAGGIAHDFNNILSAIYGYSQLVELAIDNPQKVKEYTVEVIKAAGRAKRLVAQILTFSRKTGHEKQPLQISVVIKEALKLLRSSIPTTIDIQQDIQSDAVVLADPTKIHQITMNLCTNAYHAMRDQGGTLTVSLKEVDIGKNEIIPQLDMAPGCYVLLKVSDTGTGMDTETRNKIFEPYFTTKGAGEGTGLGLAVVHGIIKDHNGYVNVYSEPKQGSSFHLYFPIIEEKALDYSVKEKKNTIKGGSERIMVVDDEEQIVNLAEKMLSHYGYKVTTFSNGVQALQEIKKQSDQYDLIITDLTMPYMTGIELTKEILAINPQLPIILNTGLSEVINKEKAKAAGVKEYCEKPIDINNLLQTIRRLLDAS